MKTTVISELIADLCKHTGGGLPVISMHAPYEVISKADLYNMHKAVVAFYTAK